MADYNLTNIDGLSLSLRLPAADGPPMVRYSAFADESPAVLALVRAPMPSWASPQIQTN